MSARRPVIGVTAYDTTAAWGVWHAPALLLPEHYLDAFFDAGAAPVILPVGVRAEEVLDRLDGVILVGGPDVDPIRYGAARDEATDTADTRRDDGELALVEGAAETGLPVLAICRGIQILNVARGGTLVQHLPDRVGHEEHSPGPGIYGRTRVELTPGTALAAIVGHSTLEVDCYHHQAIDAVGAGLTVAARADDGVIEAVEDPRLGFFVGIQWHPEVADDRSLFEALVAACSAALAR